MQYMLLNFVNLLLCFAWGWIAACRLKKIHSMVLLRFQILYVSVFAASFVCGLQFFIFGTYASWPDITASLVILGLLLCGSKRWDKGPPAETMPADLGLL